MTRESAPTATPTDHLRRATRWQFLSLLFLPPEADSLRQLVQLHGELPESEQEQALLLKEFAADPDHLPALQDAYHRLLGSTGTCPSCESAYQTGGVMGRGNVLADVAGFYEAFQFAPPARGETPGHVANELGFAALLEAKSAYHRASQEGGEGYGVCVDGVRVFLADHLMTWIPALCERLTDKAGDTFYGVAAELLQQWSKATALEVLGALPRQTALPADEPPESPPACDGCPEATT